MLLLGFKCFDVNKFLFFPKNYLLLEDKTDVSISLEWPNQQKIRWVKFIYLDKKHRGNGGLKFNNHPT